MGNKRRMLVSALSSMTIALWGAGGMAIEKLTYGTMKGVAPYELPITAASEKGFWKQQGLEVEWAPFRTSGDHSRAIVSGHVEMGTMETIPALLSLSRGIPLVLVASLNQRAVFSVWVRSDSPLKEPKELQGTKVAVVSPHDLTGSYGRMLKKALGVEFNMVGAGAIPAMVAALKARSVEATITSPGALAPLLVKGEIRELLALEKYLPRPWNEYHIYARKDVSEKNANLVKKVIRAMLQAGDFIRENPNWAIESMKASYAYSEEAAKFVYDFSFKQIGGDGKTDPKGIENVRNFLVEYDLIEKDRVPSVSEVYTTKFLQ